MTEQMITYLTQESYQKGLIFVKYFDRITELFLMHYEIKWRTRNQALIKDVDSNKEFLVVVASENQRGRRSNHIIIDKRIDDDIVDKVIIPCLSGWSRKVELF